MIPAAQRLRVVLDAGVPDSVGRVFSEFEHTVIYHRNVLPDKTPDEAVCAAALANDAILVAIDGDMKQMAKRYGVTPKGNRFDNLNIIRLACHEVMASKRLKHSMSLILHEWQYCLEKPPRRLWVDVLPHQIRTHR